VQFQGGIPDQQEEVKEVWSREMKRKVELTPWLKEQIVRIYEDIYEDDEVTLLVGEVEKRRQAGNVCLEPSV